MAIENEHNEEKKDEMMELILRSLRGEISSFEQSLLDEWCAESPEHMAQYVQVRDIWKSSKEIVSGFEPNVDQAWQRVLQRIDPKIVSISTKEAEVQKETEEADRGFSFLKIAASIALLVGLGLGIQYLVFQKPEYVSFATGNTPESIVLPDSSQLWVNKNSTVRYAKNFAEGTRTVTLDGEAFFDVKKSKTAPFIVIANRSLTRVMGTSFRIHSYKKDEFDEIDVVTGRVLFGQKNDTAKNKCFLVPGDYAKLKGNNQLVATKVSDPNHLAWKTGVLVFNETTLGDVFLRLEKYYSVSIDLDDTEILSQKFTGTFEKAPLDEALRVIAVSFSLDYVREGTQVQFKKKN